MMVVHAGIENTAVCTGDAEDGYGCACGEHPMNAHPWIVAILCMTVLENCTKHKRKSATFSFDSLDLYW